MWYNGCKKNFRAAECFLVFEVPKIIRYEKYMIESKSADLNMEQKKLKNKT